MHNCDKEARIRQLEDWKIEANKDIKGLISSLNNLANWVKTLVIVMIPVILGMFGYLVAFWVKG